MATLEDAVITTPSSAAKLLLGGLDDAAMGLDVPSPIGLAAGVSVYRLRASDYQSGSPLDQLAWRWGWRFFLTSNEKLLPAAIDVQPGRDAGEWTAGFSRGGVLTTEIELLASDRVTGADGQVRILQIPSLHWAGLWIHGTDPRLMTASGPRIASIASIGRRLRKAKATTERFLKGGNESGQTMDSVGSSPNGPHKPADAGARSDDDGPDTQ